MTPLINIANGAVENLPPSHRALRWVLWVKALVYPLARRMGLFVQYQNGTTALNYDGGTTYNTGDQVVFNYGVWESQQDGNTGNTPDVSPTRWQQVNTSFIGMNERSRYGGGRLNLEWALNRYFQTTFRQPDNPITPTPSDIYITNDEPLYVSFVSFTTEPLTSNVYTTQTSDFVFTTEVYDTASSFRFIVHIPTAVYAAINADAGIAETIVRQFLDRYVASGVFYTIATY